MTRPNEYAEIQQSLYNVGPFAPLATRPHLMGTTDYCVFMTQDITGGGAVEALPTAYCLEANRTASSAQVWCASATAGYDMLLVTPHSMLDVGPITGQTRTAAQTFRRTNVYYRRPAYRSLHRNVSFDVGNVEDTTFNPVFVCPVGVNPPDAELGDLTHNLYTDNVAVFATPSVMPMDGTPGFGGVAVKVFWQPHPTSPLTKVKLYLVRDDGGRWSKTGPWTFDIMVVSRPSTGHSTVYHNNRSYTGTPALPPVSVRPDYRAQIRSNMVPSTPTNLVHNDNRVASMVLFGFTQIETPLGCPAVPYIQSRGAGGTILSTAVVNQVNGPNLTATNVDKLVISPHSIFTGRR
jgi:hypothetical protein